MANYAVDRAEIFELMQKAGKIIRQQETNDLRNSLWASATDDLLDAVTMPSELPAYNADTLLAAFTTASREFWNRERRESKLHPPNHLRLVTPDEFDDLVREGA